MIDRDQLAALSALWEQALALDEPGRAALLEQHPALAPALRAMLADPDPPALMTLPRLPDLEPDHDAPRDGDSVGPWRLVRPLGSGGMSTVWLAERIDGMVRRAVALKLPHPWVVHSHFRERLEREREILARLAHPRIARLYDAGVTAQGQPWLALEHVEGQPITAHCDAARMDLGQRLALFLQVLDAVDHAHSHRIVHRDLKPSNILVGPDGAARLLDFGIAKLLEGDGADAGLTQLGALALTPSYASPEQVAGGSIGAQSDVYSLGVLLYELLGGTRPYALTTPSRAAIEEAILAADIEPPSVRATAAHADHCGMSPRALAAALRGDLDAIVLAALRKRPEQRYADVAAFAEDIRRHLAGKPIRARADTAWYRWSRTVRRHRVETTAIAAVVLSLAAGLVAALWQARLAGQERRTAESALLFLETVFHSNSVQQPDPMAARSTTARQLLDRGARDIDGALNDAPEAKLRLLKTLARMYDEMGLWEDALRLARKREALARTLHPAGSPTLVGVQLDLAEAAATPATEQEAIAMLDAIGPHIERNSMQQGRWLRLRAATGLHAPDRDAPRKNAADAVRVLRTHGTSCELVHALSLHGSLLVRADMLPPARAALREALALSPALPACDARMRAELQSSLCWVEGELGDATAAESSCRAALAAELRQRGPHTPLAVIRTADLATRLMRASRLAEAIALMQGVAPAAERLAQSEDLGEVNIFWSKLGEALVLHGRAADGLAVLERPSRLDHRVAERSANHGFLMERKAAALIEMGDFVQAAALLDRAQALFPHAVEVPPTQFNTSVALRVRLLLAQERAGDAAAALASFVLPPDRESTCAPDALERLTLAAEIDAARGHVRTALDAATEAERRIATSAHPEDHATWRQRLDMVRGRAALAAGEPVPAAAHFERALQRAEALFDPASPRRVEAQKGLATARAQAARH